MRRGPCLPLSLLLATAAAQDWKLTPVEPGPGPLLLFVARDDAVQPRTDRWHVVELGGQQPAREFLRCGVNLSVIARLDLRRIVVGCHGEGYGIQVVDLQQGTHRRIGDNAWVFVGTRGGDVLYLGDERHGDRKLYARPWTHDGEPRVVAEPFARVQPPSLDFTYGIGPGDAPAVSRIDLLRGGSKEIARLAAGHDADNSRVVGSPDGRRVAVGTADGILRVYDGETAELLREWRDIPLRLPVESSSSPRLEVAWHGDDAVVCSESRQQGPMSIRFVHVRRSVGTGEVLDEAPYAGNLAHVVPDPVPPLVSPVHGWGVGAKGRLRRGAFECDGDDLFHAGDQHAIANCDRSVSTGGCIGFTPDAAFALVPRDQGAWVLDVVDGAARTKRRVFSGWTCNWTLLPAAP